MTETQQLVALKGKVLVLGCDPVHGIDLASSIGELVADTEVLVAVRR